MKKSVQKFLRSFHAWGGVTLALLMLLSSITGTLLVWKEDYVRLRLPATATFNPTVENLAAIGRAIETQFDNNEILQIQFATQSFPFTKVIMTDAHYAYVDARGAVVDQWQQNERFEEWLYDLHHRLLLENVGLTLLGLAAIALLILAILGVIVFWPMRRALKRGLLPKGWSRPQLLVSHRNLGFVTVVPLALILLTGVIMAFPEQSERWLLEPFRGEDYSLDFSDGVDDISGGNSGTWLPALQRARAVFPDAQIRSATVPNDYSLYRVIGLQQPAELHPGGNSQIYIDAEGGWMDIRIDAEAQHISERIYNLSYPLHTGRVNSVLYQLILSVVGVAVAVLSFLGMVSFIKSFMGFGR